MHTFNLTVYFTDTIDELTSFHVNPLTIPDGSEFVVNERVFSVFRSSGSAEME